MKTTERQRAEFDAWWNNAVLPATQNHEGYTKEALLCAWQARQPEIDAKDAEIARLRAALSALINAKEMKENNYSGYEQAKKRVWEMVYKALEEGKKNEL